MRRWTLTTCALALLAVGAHPAAGATQAGLPGVASGHRPGPDALYQSPAHSPQLENAAPWTAPPVLVSGAQEYSHGEWLYQDFLNDDHGAAGSSDPNAPVGANAFLFSPTAGTFTYPTDPVYANNAADLVELRVKPLADATAFRVTLNSLKDAGKVGFTIALGSSPAPLPWPHGAGVTSPAQLFLTVHGTSAELTDAATGIAKAPAPTASVDATRRQIDVRVPHAAWDPGTTKVRMTIGVGLWDAPANAYLAPAPGGATASTPGGAAPSRAAIVNVGPRFDEPLPQAGSATAYTLGDAAVEAAAKASWWRELAQAGALRTGDVSAFSADVDFAKLAAGTFDDSGVPKTGPIDRILVSHHELGQGLDPSKVCFDLASGFNAASKCVGRFVGRLQPYSIYVPRKPQPAAGRGMTLLLHSLSANYNQYAGSKNQSQLGERGPGSIVITPNGRGPDGMYNGIPEADTFEVWADVARHYKLDPRWTDVSGYSMGGFGTYRYLARWPDLFARGFSVVGIPGSFGTPGGSFPISVDDQIASLRNTPLLAWNATNDELVQYPFVQATAQHLAAAGLRFEEDVFTSADHLTLATNDEYGPGAAFLGTQPVDRNPFHVTYVVDATENSRAAGAVADHAYWLSGLAERDTKSAARGTIDAVSRAFGRADPKVLGAQSGAGTLDGGTHGPMPYVSTSQAWGPAVAARKANRLDLRTTNIRAATVDVRRARLSCALQLAVTRDGPLNLGLACPVARRPAGCPVRLQLRLPWVRGQRVVSAVVARRGNGRQTVRGHDLRRLTVRGLPRRSLSLRIALRTSGKGAGGLHVVVLRRIAACG
jgi:hypothetical protein